jgi:hypothetical protein
MRQSAAISTCAFSAIVFSLEKSAGNWLENELVSRTPNCASLQMDLDEVTLNERCAPREIEILRQ